MTKSGSSLIPDKTALTARILGYGGAIPFLVGAIAASQQIAILGHAPAYLLIGYGSVILSFLGGVHWGRVITSPYLDSPYANNQTDSVWLIWSVCPSLLGWMALMLPVKAGAVVLSLSFLAALQIDRKLLREQIWPVWMGPLRFRLSLIAVGSLSSLTIS